jgi:uncharacterized protein YigA (DUF484 family)
VERDGRGRLYDESFAQRHLDGEHALGVWGAVAGSVLLLLRSRWAVTSFAVSLLGLIGSHLYQFTSQPPEGMNTASGTLFAAGLAIVAIALLWYAMRMRKQGVLK